MALCLANSLIYWRDFFPYDQMVRYKWWYRHGYMSSTGHCFDIGAATRQSIQEFEQRQRKFAEKHGLLLKDMDFYQNGDHMDEFDVNCSKDGVAGNGALMRLAPAPLFFYLNPSSAIEYSGESGRITHGDKRAVDACRYYGALIVAALQGEKRDALLSNTFVNDYKEWFGKEPLHEDIMKISTGSYKKTGGYNDGIRGKGFIVSALEAALWAFWSDNDSFETGALNAVNLGDDTDTTAAIYGQLAGAYYGFEKLPKKWRELVYAKDFLLCLTQWIEYEGYRWFHGENPSASSDVLINSDPSESTTFNLSMKSRQRGFSYIERRSYSLGSISANLIIRKSNNNAGQLGSLYNAYEDSIITSLNLNPKWKANQSNPNEECFCWKGDDIEYEKLFQKLNIDDELRLSLLTNIISPNGILCFPYYPYLPDRFTRIIFYSKSIHHSFEQITIDHF